MNRCPSCKKEISIKKYKLYTCICGAKLLAVPINKELTIQDVTIEYDRHVKHKY